MSKLNLPRFLSSRRKRSSSASIIETGAIPKIKIPWTEMPPPSQPLAKTMKSKVSQSLDSVEDWFNSSREKLEYYQNHPRSRDRSREHSMDRSSAQPSPLPRARNSVSDSNIDQENEYKSYNEVDGGLEFSFDIAQRVEESTVYNRYKSGSTSKDGRGDQQERPSTPSFLSQRRTAQTFEHISVTTPNLQSLVQSSRESVSSAVSSRTRDKVKKRFWWFSRMGDASKAFEEVGHDIHDTLPVLMQHADDAICAVREVSVALCGLATGEQIDFDPDTPGTIEQDKIKSVPEALFSISEAAHSFATVMNEQKVDEILRTIRDISRASQHTMTMVQQTCDFILNDGRILFSLGQSFVFLIGSGLFLMLMLTAQFYIRDLSKNQNSQYSLANSVLLVTNWVTILCLLLACTLLVLSALTFGYLYFKNVRKMIS